MNEEANKGKKLKPQKHPIAAELIFRNEQTLGARPNHANFFTRSNVFEYDWFVLFSK